jgi:PKD repeat protein
VDTPVQLTGSDFIGAPNVLIDGPGLDATWLLSVTLVNSSTLDAVVPAGLAWGTYSVTLYNGDCQQSTLPSAFTLVGTCDISPTVTLTNPGATELDEAPAFTAVATGTQPLQYTWDFGGSGSGTNLDTATPEFYYDVPGTYTVTVTATDPCGDSDVATTTVDIYCNAPTAMVAMDEAVVELGAAQHFTATATGTQPLAYAWDFGGAGSGSGLDTATPTFTYDAPGAYTATVTVTGPCGVATDTVAIEITCDPAEVSLDADATTVELGETIHFTANITSAYAISYAWDFDGAGTGENLDTTHPSFTYDEAGTYTVTLTVTNQCGSVQATLVVDVVCYPPHVTLSGTHTVEMGLPVHFEATVISGTGPFTYTWDFGGAGSGSGLDTATPSFTYDALGTYTPTVTVSNPDSSTQASMNVDVMCYAPQATLDAIAPVAFGQAIQPTARILSGTAPFTTTWDFGGAGIGSGLDTITPTFTYDAPGTYTVTFTVANAGDAVSVQRQALIYQALTGVTISGDSLIAVDEAASFTASALPLTATEPISYVWDNGSVGASAVYSWTEAGEQTVTVTATHAYTTASSSFDLTTFDAVRILSLNSDSPVDEGAALHATAVITGAEPYTLTWDFGGAGVGADLDTPTPTYTYTQAGSYTLTLTATHAYPTMDVQQLVVMVGQKYDVFLPLITRNF